MKSLALTTRAGRSATIARASSPARTSSARTSVWLDQVLPMYKKDVFELEACIGMQKSTNHRFRMIDVWRRR